jgi:hypothetical protein
MPSAASVTWSEVLDRVETALRAAETQTVEQERALATLGGHERDETASRVTVAPSWEANTERWKKVIQQADEMAAETDVISSGDDEVLRRWLASVADLKGKMANRAAAPVS